MATSTKPCCICDRRHITKPSEIWCPECEEGLCKECMEHHSLSNSTQKHVVIPIHDYQKLPDFITEIKTVCKKHDENYQLFCKTHDSLCCVKCSIECHKKCHDVTLLEEITKNPKSSIAFEEVTTSLQELEENIKRIRMDREDNLDQVMKKRKLIEEEIKQFRHEINTHLDKLQEKLMRALFKTEENLKTEMQSLTTVVTEEEKQIKDYQSDVQKIKLYASDLQTYLGMKQIETEISKKEKFIRSLNENGSIKRTSISWTMDPTVKTLVSNLKTFGEIVVTSRRTHVRLSTKKQTQAQAMSTIISFENIKLTLHHKSKLNIKDITGCAISRSGKMAFAKHLKTFVPSKVILTDADGRMENTISLSKGCACDITFTDDNAIAVTCGRFKCIELIDIKENKSKRIIHTNSDCFGITYKDGCLIYCAEGRGLRRINLVNDEITTILNFNLSFLAYVSTFNDNLYYTDCGKTVGCCDMKGSIIWNISDKSMLKEPNGITVDERGNVFIADYEESSIVVISPGGKQHRKLLLPENTVVNPRGLCYDRASNLLLVANENDTILLFKVV